jgi:hypothetical protein
MNTYTVTTTTEHTFREGWGVFVDPCFDHETDLVAEIDVTVVPITEAGTTISGNVPCVAVWPGAFVPVENFANVPDLATDDTHDLRSRWFATEEEAREHAADVEQSWRHPNPWQSFVTLD